MSDRRILHYSTLDWEAVGDRRWTWCGRSLPRERLTGRVEAVTCIVCRRGILMSESARVAGDRFRLRVRGS